MSYRALLKAVQETLVTDAGLPANEVQQSFQGRPPASAGTWFYGIHRGPRQRSSPHAQTSFDAYYEVNVTISMKMDAMPYDRLYHVLSGDVGKCLEDKVQLVCTVLDQDCHDNRVLNRANALLEALQDPSPQMYFLEPLTWLGDDDAVPVETEWWLGAASESALPGEIAGVKSTIRFGGVRRMQPHGDIS